MNLIFLGLLLLTTFFLGIALSLFIENGLKIKTVKILFLKRDLVVIISISLIMSLILFYISKCWIANVVNDIIPNSLSENPSSGNIANAGLDSGSGARGDAFGGSIGPLIAWFAALLTFAAFWVQYAANKQQREDLQLEHFESRFFKFIDYHRENVNELLYRKPQSSDEEYFKGNQVFTVIYYEIKELLEEFIENKYQHKVLSFQEKVEAINFVYQCIFYGAVKHTKENFKTRFPSEFFNYVDFYARQAEYTFNGKRHVYYSGHVRRLGHYFRNIYQAVSYLETQKFLNANQKYEYMSTFRAQMSVYEQAVFFFNSISDLGKRWERVEYEKNISDVNRNEIYPELLVTVYDLVRNTLFEDGEVAKGIFINEFYPLLNLERKDECARSGVLPFVNNKAHICRFCFSEKYIGFENKQVERKIKEAYKYRPTEFDYFRCDEDNCKTTMLLNQLRNKSD